MQLQRTRDTEPEMAVRRILHAAGLRYRVDRAPLPGLRRKADIVFGPSKVAVFIDGCFWHGCLEHGRASTKANPEYWSDKIERNRQRDLDTDDRLGKAGWTVVRAWEHEAASEVAVRIEATVRRIQAGGAPGPAAGELRNEVSPDAQAHPRSRPMRNSESALDDRRRRPD